MNKSTLQRIENTLAALMTELVGFQLSDHLERTEPEVVDLRLFGLRFKLTEIAKPQDDEFELVLLPNEQAINREELFLLLASKGYIHWLRNRTASGVLFRILEHQDRWRRILELAIQEAQDRKKGEYIVGLYQEMLDAPSLLAIYNHDDTLFDWVLK